MTAKNTFNIFKNKTFKGLFLAFMLMTSVGASAQIVVESVFPRRVTYKTEITITGGTGFTNGTNLVLDSIAYVSRTASNGGTQLTFEISRQEIGDAGDVQSSTLKIGTQDVYVGDIHSDSLVKIEYVGPTPKNMNSNSTNRVREVYTSWKGFYSSKTFNESNEATYPDDRHDLLGFKMVYGGGEEVIFSTGVADEILEPQLTALGIDILNPTKYKSQVFKAYSTNGIKGSPHDENYLSMADQIDKAPGETELNSFVKATVYDVIIDGENGLDMGTGISNFNEKASISFFSGDGNILGIDDVPDLLITQIARPVEKDIYYYANIEGDVIGRPIILEMKQNDPFLFSWFVNFFRMDETVPYDISYPVSELELYQNIRDRDFRMAAFKLEEFEITAENLSEINNINMMAGGAADIAFIAYNQAAFPIASPIVTKRPVSRSVCKVPSGTSVVFSVLGDAYGGESDCNEPLKYQWYKNFSKIPGAESSTYTIDNVQFEDLQAYKVRIVNCYGAIDLPVELTEGITPYTWNGTSWSPPPAYVAANLSVDPMDRNLVFSGDYNGEDLDVGGQNLDLEGCDCLVKASANVTIPKKIKMKLYGSITVDPAGTFTLENNASLIQTKALPLVGGVNDNKNSGNITVKRVADGLKKNDYVYWSSPVADFDVATIPGSPTYSWDVGGPAKEGNRGNWVSASGDMLAGKGYIVRVPGGVEGVPLLPLPNTFVGTPNNGEYEIPVQLTPEAASNLADNRNWNLIGNPYPSAINADDFLTKNALSIEVIDGSVYLWTHATRIMPGGTTFYQNFGYNYNTNDYLVYNVTAPSVPTFDGKIASGQGFFVKAKVNDNVKFTNAMRYDTNENAYNNTQFYRTASDSKTAKDSDSEKQLLWLALTNEAKIATVAVVGYVQGATYGEDNLYDASHMGNNDFSLYTQVAEDRLVIQGRPLPFDSADKVTLGVAVPKNGIYSIAIDHLKGSVMLNTEQAIFLEDTYQNVIHNLRNAPYSFTATAGDIKDRFVLRYTDQSLSVNEEQLSETFAYIINGQLHVKAAKNIEAITVYDLTGKKVMDYTMDDNSNSLSTAFQFAKGVYLTVITLENSGSVTKKVMN